MPGPSPSLQVLECLCVVSPFGWFASLSSVVWLFNLDGQRTRLMHSRAAPALRIDAAISLGVHEAGNMWPCALGLLLDARPARRMLRPTWSLISV